MIIQIGKNSGTTTNAFSVTDATKESRGGLMVQTSFFFF